MLVMCTTHHQYCQKKEKKSVGNFVAIMLGKNTSTHVLDVTFFDLFYQLVDSAHSLHILLCQHIDIGDDDHIFFFVLLNNPHSIHSNNQLKNRLHVRIA